MTKPADLGFEIFVFGMYRRIMEHLREEWLERTTTLEDD